MRKPDLVACKTQERLGGRPICEIYLNTYFQRARLGGRLICEIGLYASIYGIYISTLLTYSHILCIRMEPLPSVGYCLVKRENYSKLADFEDEPVNIIINEQFF